MLSSSWEAESRKHKTWSKESQPWMASPLREQIKAFQDKEVVQEFIDAIGLAPIVKMSLKMPPTPVAAP